MTEATRQPSFAPLAVAALVGGALVLAGALVGVAATTGMGSGMMGMADSGQMMDGMMMERMEQMHEECIAAMQEHHGAHGGNMTADG